MQESALPPIVVVKLGGEVVTSPQLPVIAQDLVTIAAQMPVVVVHGGGAQATALQRALGQEPVIVHGRRVTDAAALDVMKMVVAGRLNVDLCSALVAAGGQPVGLHGASSCVLKAVKTKGFKNIATGALDTETEYGFVGDVVGVHRALLETLLRSGFLPVLACLGADEAGQTYNINADAAANGIAATLAARTVVLISDVPGVLRDIADPSTRFPRLNRSEASQLMSEGVIRAGMIPKLEESFAALDAGAGSVVIVGRLGPGDLAKAILEPGSLGTVLTA